MTRRDLSEWRTKKDVAKAIKRSTKAVEGWEHKGKLQKAFRRNPQTGRRETVYHPDDVIALTAALNPPTPPFVVPDAAPHALSVPTATTEDGLHALARSVAECAAVFHRLLIEVSSRGENTEKVGSQKVLSKKVLTIDEAAAESGWTRTKLLRCIHDKTLPAEKDRGWKIRRRDLDAL